MVELLGVVFVTLFVGLFVRLIRFLGTIVSKKPPETLGEANE
jgi:Na+-transporting methylmalonyl-CoA/oxaloacetate decarboxylase gamma subunit